MARFGSDEGAETVWPGSAGRFGSDIGEKTAGQSKDGEIRQSVDSEIDDWGMGRGEGDRVEEVNCRDRV